MIQLFEVGLSNFRFTDRSTIWLDKCIIPLYIIYTKMTEKNSITEFSQFLVKSCSLHMNCLMLYFSYIF